MSATLVDTNVLIDVLGPAELPFRVWSLAALKNAVDSGAIVLSAVVWAELARPAMPESVLRQLLSWLRPRTEDFPFSAAYPAGCAHALYRQRGGSRQRTLPDFLVGAHALVAGHRLLTRDAARYRSYFPGLDVIAPDTHP